jgi:hypothetical protein
VLRNQAWVHLDPAHANWLEHRSHGLVLEMYPWLICSHRRDEAGLGGERDPDPLTGRQPPASQTGYR